MIALERQLQAVNARNAYLETVARAQHAPTFQYSSDQAAPIARSKSTSGHGFPTSSRIESQPVKRQTRASSQHSPSAMSNRPDSTHPTRQNGRVASLSSSPMNRSFSSRDDLAKRSPSGMSQRLESVHEHGPLVGVGIDPAEYIANAPDEDSYLASTRMNLSPTDIYQSNKLSACPSMYSGSSAYETSPMTRQNSSFDNINGNWPTSTPMINSSSSQSMFNTSLWSDSQPSMFPNMSPSTEKQPGSDQDLLGLGATFPSQEYSPTFDSSMLFPPDSVSMERSASNTSTSSARSTTSNLARRARERSEQVLHNSKTQIRPKAQEPTSDSPPAPTKKSKITAKKPHQRRKHPRVHCELCKDRPEFRGEHELQRHINAKHSTSVTKFVCRDPATLGLYSALQPKVPLKGCKSCDNDKLYGAYYNAAAHLRRWHFKPKTGRGKGAKSSNDEKRGGSAGGHWPPMEDLKMWFEERVIHQAQGSTPAEMGDVEEEMLDIEDVSGEISVDTELDPFVDVTTGYEEVTMPTGSIQSAQVSPDLPEFMGYPFAGDASPIWGSASSNALTPPNYDFYEPQFHG